MSGLGPNAGNIAGTASGTSFTPAGNIAATDVQAAIQELDTEKEPAITTLSIAKGGTNSSTALTNGLTMISSGGKIVESATTSTELGYVHGVTSDIQTQLNGKQATITQLPINQGGTNSVAALNNNRVMKSSGGAIVEAAAITGNKALASDANGIPVATAVTDTELGYLSGASSNIQTQITAKLTNPLTTKGDILGYDSAANRVPVGANGTVLTADSTQALGVKWVAASGGVATPQAVDWTEGVDSPLVSIRNGLTVYDFDATLGQFLTTAFRVPQSYAQAQILLKMLWSSMDTQNTVLFQTVTTLIRAGTDQINSTTNQRTSTNAAVTMSSAKQNIPQALSCDLTDSTGKINGVTVSAGDLLIVKFQRPGAALSDSSLDFATMYPFASQLICS